MSDCGNAAVGRARVNRPNVARNDEVGFLPPIAVASLRLWSQVVDALGSACVDGGCPEPYIKVW
jgi:hypothetical protein